MDISPPMWEACRGKTRRQAVAVEANDHKNTPVNKGKPPRFAY